MAEYNIFTPLVDAIAECIKVSTEVRSRTRSPSDI